MGVASQESISIRRESNCPVSALERCRWEIRAQMSRGGGILFNWDKSVVTEHSEKPMAQPIQCNVDRDFNMAGGGYLKVWFQGEDKPCEPWLMGPEVCGVDFLFAGDPQYFSPTGFRVKGVAGKRLDRVELKSTLNLQCGEWNGVEKKVTADKWESLVGWERERGFYNK